MYHELMRIECPACATSYDVPDERLAPGQVARCARCGSDWMPLGPLVERETALDDPEPATLAVLEAAAPDTSLPEEPAPSPAAEPIPAPREATNTLALRLAWGLSVAVLLGALWAAYAARESVMRSWPPSIRAYAALGVARNH